MWTCSSCGRENEEQLKECLNCKAPRDVGQAAGGTERRIVAVASVPVPDRVPRRYRALRTVAGVFKVLAWITGGISVVAAILCVIAAVITIAGGVAEGMPGGFAADALPDTVGVAAFMAVMMGSLALGYLISGLIMFLCFYAAAEAIVVIIDIEENTRATRARL